MATQQAFEYFLQTGRFDYIPEPVSWETVMDRDDISFETIDKIVQKTALSPTTIVDLLTKGWIFTERSLDGSIWIGPEPTLNQSHS